jgi:hypothetical protein
MKDKVKDQDTHFIIDGFSRLVTNEAETKSMLVQYDHNSERFTFRVPRFVDSHDLSECNMVRVHYINLDKAKRNENGGLDDITDTLSVCPDDDQQVMCSWLITDGATQLAGFLHFVVQFAVVDGTTVKYSWNTAKYTGVTIADGIKKDKEFVTEHIDILKEWESRLQANHIVNLEQTQYGDGDGGENVWTVTFGDGRTQELKVNNGTRGEEGLIGSAETITGEVLRFFVGTKEEYNALDNEQKIDLYAIFTDDTTKSDIYAEIERVDAKNKDESYQYIPYAELSKLSSRSIHDLDKEVSVDLSNIMFPDKSLDDVIGLSGTLEVTLLGSNHNFNFSSFIYRRSSNPNAIFAPINAMNMNAYGQTVLWLQANLCIGASKNLYILGGYITTPTSEGNIITNLDDVKIFELTIYYR